MRKLQVALTALVLALLCSACGRPTEPEGRVMYFCGYDRCRDSGAYGELLYATGINVWNNPEPNRGGVHHRANHHDQVTVVEEKRVAPGPGGLWYRLAQRGWTNDLWLTQGRCTTENLERYSFADCLAGDYSATSTPVGTKPNAYMRCRLHIKRELANPSSAVFPHISTVTAFQSGDTWVINDDFQAQDVDDKWYVSDFECKVRYVGDGEWELVDLSLDKR